MLSLYEETFSVHYPACSYNESKAGVRARAATTICQVYFLFYTGGQIVLYCKGSYLFLCTFYHILLHIAYLCYH